MLHVAKEGVKIDMSLCANHIEHQSGHLTLVQNPIRIIGNVLVRHKCQVIYRYLLLVTL